MRPARSRRSLYGNLAEVNGTDESSDASSAEEESQVRSFVHTATSARTVHTTKFHDNYKRAG